MPGVKQQVSESPTDTENLDGTAPEDRSVSDVSVEGAEEGSSPSDVKDADLLSVARDVLAGGEGEEDPESSTGKAADGTDAVAEPQAPQAPADPDDFESNPPPFAKHPRWRQLTARLQHYKQGHQQFEQIRSFLDSNRLSDEEAADVLIIGGLMKTNPVEAWARAAPAMEKLALAAGEILSPDLRDKVEKGLMTRDTALSISRAHARAASATNYAQHTQQVSQRQAEARETGTVRDAIASWENGKRTSDPDYGRKELLIQNHIVAHVASRGRPRTAAEAVQLAEAAYKAVSAVTVATRPRPQAKRMVTGGRVSGNPATQPATHMDYVRRALGPA